jgi:hypothetical protein
MKRQSEERVRTMATFPVVLVRWMTRRALVTLCFLRRSIPASKRDSDESQSNNVAAVRTNAQVGPCRHAFAVRRKLEHFRFDRVRRLFVLFTFTFDITFTTGDTILLRALGQGCDGARRS